MPPQIPGERHPRFQHDDFGGGTPPPSPYGFGYEMGPERGGPDWERAEMPLFSRWWTTVMGVLCNPKELFAGMRTEGGIGAPLVFATIGIVIGAVATGIYQLVQQAIGFGMTAGSGSEEEMMVAFFGSGVGVGFTVCISPFIAVAFLFIMSGLYHLILMAFGGTRTGYEGTFRCVAYVTGATALLQLIPICGGCVAGIWHLVALVIALSEAQEVGIGKAIGAVVIVTLLCCAVGFTIGFTIAVAIGAAMAP